MELQPQRWQQVDLVLRGERKLQLGRPAPTFIKQKATFVEWVNLLVESSTLRANFGLRPVLAASGGFRGCRYIVRIMWWHTVES